MYYSYGDKIGGPVTYINTIMNSHLKEEYEFVTCYQNMAPGGLNINLLVRMVRKIKQESPDIVHVHGIQSEGFYGVVAAQVAGCQNIVLTVHGFAFDGQQSSKVKRVLYRYVIEPITIKLSSKVYCVCEYASKRKIIKNNARKNDYGYIHNCAPDLSLTETRENVRKELGILTNEIVFIISGRVTKEKGFDILEKSIKILNKKGISNYKVIVLGNGDYYKIFCELMEQEIEQKQVLMIGQTNRVADYLNASDIFILPSYHENLPIALLEAGKMGLACIASNAGGIPEVIINGKTGYIIQELNPEYYAEKMEFMITHPDMLKRMKEYSKLNTEQKFSIDEMCTKIREIYE